MGGGGGQEKKAKAVAIWTVIHNSILCYHCLYMATWLVKYLKANAAHATTPPRTS